jgi:hypothetical protein
MKQEEEGLAIEVGIVVEVANETPSIASMRRRRTRLTHVVSWSYRSFDFWKM